MPLQLLYWVLMLFRKVQIPGLIHSKIHKVNFWANLDVLGGSGI
jgi:hypothetical protein